MTTSSGKAGARKAPREQPTGQRLAQGLAVGSAVLAAGALLVILFGGADSIKATFTQVEPSYLELAFPDAGGDDSPALAQICAPAGQPGLVTFEITAHQDRAGDVVYRVAVTPSEPNAAAEAAPVIEEGSIQAPDGEPVTVEATIDPPAAPYVVTVSVEGGDEQLIRHCKAA